MKKTRGWWRLAGLAGLVLVAYSNSFDAGLVFDNASAIGEDPRIREATAANVEAIVDGPYWYGNSGRGTAQYRPLTTLSYLVNYAVLGYGTDPVGYHWVNLGLHEINLALVYALGLLIFGEAAPALALAAIWGLHPVLTESVTNIVGRADLLAGTGVLAGLLCHVKAAGEIGRRRAAWLAGVAAAQALGIFSKENAVMLPAILLVYDLTRANGAGWRKRAAGYGAALVPIAAFLYIRGGLHMRLAIDAMENPLAAAGFWTARMTAVKVIGWLLWLFAWPARLSADYSYNAVRLFRWDDGMAWLSLAVCAGALALAVLLAVKWRKPGRAALFFLMFFAVAMAPTSNLILTIGSVMAERFLYLPAVGLAGCVVAAAVALGPLLAKKRPDAARIAWAVLAVVCVAYTARTYARNQDWRDEQTLWRSTVEASPSSARPHYNLALQLERSPDGLAEAVSEYRAALAIAPDFSEAHSNLGTALARSGQLAEAIVEFREALRREPDNAAMHKNLATALAESGRLAEAIAEYEAALRLHPDAQLQEAVDRLKLGLR